MISGLSPTSPLSVRGATASACAPVTYHGGGARVVSRRSFFPPSGKDLPMTTPLREQMRQDLQLAGLVDGSQDVYLRAVKQLAAHYHKPPDRLTEQQVRDYLLHLKNEKRLSPSSLQVVVSALRFLYTHTVRRDWKTLKQVRVPKHRPLPDVLTIDEVRRLIDAVRTP